MQRAISLDYRLEANSTAWTVSYLLHSFWGGPVNLVFQEFLEP